MNYITIDSYIEQNMPWVDEYCKMFDNYAEIVDAVLKQKYSNYKKPFKRLGTIIKGEIHHRIGNKLRKEGYVVVNAERKIGTPAKFMKITDEELRYKRLAKNTIIRGQIFTRKARKQYEKLKKMAKRRKKKYEALNTLFDMVELTQQNLIKALSV